MFTIAGGTVQMMRNVIAGAWLDRLDDARGSDRQALPTCRAQTPRPATAARALDRYDDAVRHLLGWGRDAPAASAKRRSARTPASALAHAGAAICLFLEERFAPARAAAERARRPRRARRHGSVSHVEAVALLVGGRPAKEAERQMVEHLDAWPRDLVVLQRLYFVWFWQGRFPEILQTEDPSPAGLRGDDSFVLGLHAFALEQVGPLPGGRSGGGNRDRTESSGRLGGPRPRPRPLRDGGVRRGGRPPAPRHPSLSAPQLVPQPPRLAPRPDAPRVAATRRAPSGCRARHSSGLRRPSRATSTTPSRSSDKRTSWGCRSGGRWSPFAAIARERLDRQGLLFHAAHLGMALAGAGDWATAETSDGRWLRQRAPKDASRTRGRRADPARGR